MSSRSTQIIGGAGRQHAYVDAKHNAITVVDEVHAAIHKGMLWSAGTHDLAVAAAGTLDIGITVPSGTIMHARFNAFVSAEATAALYEGSTFGGTLVTPRNRNRVTGDSGLPASLEVRTTLTGVTLGTLLFQGYLPGGSRTQAVGSDTKSFEEWILPAGNYIARLTNLDGAQTIRATLVLDFYL